MRSTARFLIHLYPASWRERYGEEFQALLEDSAPSFSAVLDLMKGAMKMHLKVPSFPKLALLLSVAGMLAGWGISFLVTPSYISQATLLLAQQPGSAPADHREAIGVMQQQVLSRTSLSAIITDGRLDLYRSERSREPLEDVIETMRNRDVQITLAGTGAAFTVSFTASDPVKAHDTVQTLITKFQEANIERQRVPVYVKHQRSYDQIDRMEARIAVLEKRLGIPPSQPDTLDELVPAADQLNLDVLDPASLPGNPVRPNRYIFASFGFGAGFIVALIVAIFRRPVRPAIPFPAQPA
jgi:capsular polysaccharide biosynthesis protein